MEESVEKFLTKNLIKKPCHLKDSKQLIISENILIRH